MRLIGLLSFSSLLNAAIAVGAFFFRGFATDPEMDDVTMRVGYHVLSLICLAAIGGMFVPWVLAFKTRRRGALLFAMAPTVLICLAIVAFLTLDSWLRRTFAG